MILQLVAEKREIIADIVSCDIGVETILYFETGNIEMSEVEAEDFYKVVIMTNEGKIIQTFSPRPPYTTGDNYGYSI